MRFSQELESSIKSKFLEWGCSHRHQRPHHRLLYVEHPKLGLLQGHLLGGHPLIPDRLGHHRLQLHLPDLCLHPRGEHDR